MPTISSGKGVSLRHFNKNGGSRMTQNYFQERGLSSGILESVEYPLSPLLPGSL